MIGLIEGRMVHYVDDAGVHNAATIVHVHSSDGTVNLFVPPRTAEGTSRVEEKKSFSSRKHVGTWHWPERVEE